MNAPAKLGCLLVCALLAAGCSSYSTNYDWDTEFEFGGLQTFTWSAVPADAEGDPLIRNRIRESVTRGLEDSGYQQVSDSADFRVAIHLGTQDKVDVVDWGYGYGRRRWHGRSDISVYNYREGTIVVDVIEEGTDELVWRGTVRGVMSSNPTPEQRTERIDAAVQELLAGFPPS